MRIKQRLLFFLSTFVLSTVSYIPAHAQLIGIFGNVGPNSISFSLDGQSATNVSQSGSGPDLYGSAITLGTTLSGGVSWKGNRCNGCSANITCYQAQDQTNQYLNSPIISFNAYNYDGFQTFNWSPPSRGVWYINCDINYYNNPGAGNPASALTQHIVINVN